MSKRISCAILLLSLGLAMAADAHSGRLDSNGGHYNRKTGEYHYHRGGGRSSTSSTKKTRIRSTKTKKTRANTTRTKKTKSKITRIKRTRSKKT